MLKCVKTHDSRDRELVGSTNRERWGVAAADTTYADQSAYYENTPIQIYWKFHHQNWKFSNKNSDIFHISAQNIDCRYSLEPPLRGGSNEYTIYVFWAEIRKIMYTPVNPSFTI